MEASIKADVAILLDHKRVVKWGWVVGPMEQELRAPWPFDSAGLGENTLQLCRPSVVVSSDSRHLKRALRSSAFRQGPSASALTEVFTSHCITQLCFWLWMAPARPCQICGVGCSSSLARACGHVLALSTAPNPLKRPRRREIFSAQSARG